MLHRIGLAMQSDSFKMSGDVEVDETFIGGKARNMHKNRRAQRIRARGPIGKAIVLGVLERHAEGHSRVQVKVIPNRMRPTMHAEVRSKVEPGSALYTDELSSYVGLEDEYMHQAVNYAREYVRGKVHTNGL